MPKLRAQSLLDLPLPERFWRSVDDQSGGLRRCQPRNLRARNCQSVVGALPRCRNSDANAARRRREIGIVAPQQMICHKFYGSDSGTTIQKINRQADRELRACSMTSTLLFF